MLEGVEGDAVAPVKFGGVYLPLEIPPTKCVKDPLLVKKNGKHKEPGKCVKDPLLVKKEKNGKHKEAGKCVKDPLWGGPSPPIGHAPPRGVGELPPTK